MKIRFKDSLFLLVFTTAALTGLSLRNGNRNEVQRSSKDQLTALQSDIDRILLNVDQNAHLGIEIVSIKSGQKLYQKNSSQLFVPASCLKLFTAGAALAGMGQDYRFETKLLTDGEIDGRVLKGNLFIKGTGDPELSIDHLEEMVFQLKLMRIEQITGDLIADNTDFDGIAQGPGWMWDEGAEYWNSPMDALTVNHSCLKLWIKPADEVSKPPLIYVYPKTSYVSVQNSALTVSRDAELKVGRPPMSKHNLIEVKGGMKKDNKAQEFYVPVDAPHLFTANILRDLLGKYGIKFQGSIKSRAAPSKVKSLVSHHSAPLALLMHRMLKTSDNLSADCFFKKLGQMHFGEVGTWQRGGQTVREFLKCRAGLEVEEMVILDGCGLSRYNLASPHQITAFLAWAQKQPQFAAEFMASLPVAGIDGTLKDRMKQPNLIGNLRAKSGTMAGISSLAGYVTTKDGDLLAFTILINGFVKTPKDYKLQVEDQICGLLADFSYH